MALQNTGMVHHRHRFHLDHHNITIPERWMTGALGSVAVAYGLSRSMIQPIAAVPLTIAGTGALLRALRGRSRLYRNLGVQRPAKGSPLAERMPHAIVFEHAVTIQRPVADVFAAWSKVEDLPRYMPDILSVTRLGDNTTRWVVRAPGGLELVWDAERTINRKERIITWRSLDIADIRQEGFVLFTPVDGNRGTEMTFQMAYTIRGGRLTMLMGKVLRNEPSYQIREALRRFKQVMEAGDIPTTKRHPFASARPPSYN